MKFARCRLLIRVGWWCRASELWSRCCDFDTRPCPAWCIPWMSDVCGIEGKPSWHVIGHLGQFILPFLRICLANVMDVPMTCLLLLTCLLKLTIHCLNDYLYSSESHVLRALLPEKSSHGYNLCNRHHNRQLTRKSTYVNDRSFLTRMLFRDSYWLFLS